MCDNLLIFFAVICLKIVTFFPAYRHKADELIFDIIVSLLCGMTIPLFFLFHYSEIGTKIFFIFVF